MVEQVIATSERTSFYILSREGTHESLYKSDGSNSSVFLTQDEGTVLPLPPPPSLSPFLHLPFLSLPPSLSLSFISMYMYMYILSSDMESMMECFAASSLIVEESKFVHAREA